MKANIIIRQPVNLGCREALDLIKGDKIVCRRCGEGEVEILIEPSWGAPIVKSSFAFSNCQEAAVGERVEALCQCGGLLFYNQPMSFF